YDWRKRETGLLPDVDKDKSCGALGMRYPDCGNRKARLVGRAFHIDSVDSGQFPGQDILQLRS
ncbi:hypothetical protein, partial [Salmonella sp. SAL4454]|uniref:hypothetical protein n=1 Tax=Salmonella sp. SAL4454 TaxID=3159909 RepID=UPI003978CB61